MSKEMEFERTVVDDMAEEIAEAVDEAEKAELAQLDADLHERELVHTGSVMLNLACSDRWHGGFPIGAMANIIGDSFVGKSFLGLHLLAHAAYDERFKDFTLVYDDVERRFMFDEELFGPKFVERVEAPPKDHSDTVFDWFVNLETLFKKGKPFIYVLDSLDALTGGDEEERLTKMAEGKGAGGYGTIKAKSLSEMLRAIRVKLKNTGSFLLVISQVRESLDAMSFERYRRAGGKALKFYCTHEVWLTRASAITKTTRGLTREIGVNVKAKVKKNSLTGRPREASFAFLHGYGVDDIRSVAEFLCTTKVFTKKKGTIEAEPFDFSGTLEKFISFIEEDPEREKRLYELAEQTWREIEESLKPKRKPVWQRFQRQ